MHGIYMCNGNLKHCAKFDVIGSEHYWFLSFVTERNSPFLMRFDLHSQLHEKTTRECLLLCSNKQKTQAYRFKMTAELSSSDI